MQSYCDLSYLKQYLLFFAIINRIIVLGLGIIFHYISQDYDLSSSSSIFLKWDAVYFDNIAKVGYEFEHELAFYPGFPFLIRLFNKIFPFFSISFNELLIPTLCYFGSVFMLVKVTIMVGFSQRFAFKTGILFCFSPISIFMFAPYTESPFFLFTLLGIYYWIKKNYFLTSLFFVFASTIRSNGFLLGGFFLYSILDSFIHFSSQSIDNNTYSNSNFNSNDHKNDDLKSQKNALIIINSKSNFNLYKSFLKKLFDISSILKSLYSFSFKTYIINILNLLFTLIQFVPSFLFSKFANKKFCSNDGFQNVEWCGKSPYQTIQSKYWNVGFLKYWRKEQIPNFLLALPISCFVYIFIWKSRKNSNTKLIPFIIHLGFLTTFSIFNANVQVTTRIVLAASPAAWWALASSNYNKLVIIYCLSYLVLGTVLFVKFLPWT